MLIIVVVVVFQKHTEYYVYVKIDMDHIKGAYLRAGSRRSKDQIQLLCLLMARLTGSRGS